MDKYQVLKQYFGYDSFREGQEEIITGLEAGRDVMAIMPTGAGKSLCYQVPGIASGKTMVVVSPLISLMKDQVDALENAGVPAIYLNSSLTEAQYRDRLRGIYNNQFRIIYVAPERLETEGFINAINSLKEPLKYLIVDEAHCVSRWGHDFRPSYTRISEFISMLSSRPVIGAFTATATDVVRTDIEESLRLSHPLKFITGFDRPNLEFKVFNGVDKDKYIRDYVKSNPEDSGIIYAATRKDTVRLQDMLKKHGIVAGIYHGGMSDKARNEAQEAFLYDDVAVMVATNAFGMGIDKSNVRYVIHYNMPRDVESYYQEAGRAGRDGLPSTCILLYSPGDTAIQKFFIDEGQISDSRKHHEYKKLQQMESYCHTSSCLRKYMLSYFGDDSGPDRCHNCSVCNSEAELKDVTLEAQMILSCINRSGQRFGRSMVVDILRGSKNKKLLSFGMDRMKTYGLMAAYKKKDMDLLMNKLIAEGYIFKTEDQYPVLKLTPKSIPVLKNEEKVMMQIPKKIKKELVSNDLLTKLKALRKKIATREGYPPYVIFPDSALIEMCNDLPVTPEQLADVKGVGESRLKKYGIEFLEVIREHTGSDKRTQTGEKLPQSSKTRTKQPALEPALSFPLHIEPDDDGRIANEAAQNIGAPSPKERKTKLKPAAAPGPADKTAARQQMIPELPIAEEAIAVTGAAEPSYLKYVKAYQEGLPPVQIAELHQVQEQTVENNLFKAYGLGEDIDISRFSQRKYEKDILSLLLEDEWDGRLAYIKERLPEDVSYTNIKAAIAKMKRRLLKF